MSKFTRTWFDCSEDVLDEHSDIEVRQRYLFILTQDKQVVIVSKGGEDWQFPGGHPNPLMEGQDGEEEWEETLVREVWEETGLNIEDILDSISKLGYYLIEFPKEKFLQERYAVVLDCMAKDLKLETHEREDDNTVTIKFVKAVPISEIEKYVSWAPEVEGWNKALEYLAEKILLSVFRK